MSSTGTVKWFNTTKGYGFIQPDNGGADVFVHISAVEKAGLRTLNENEKVSYDLVTEKGKTSAEGLLSVMEERLEEGDVIQMGSGSFRIL